jgi:hypothetical protein
MKVELRELVDSSALCGVLQAIATRLGLRVPQHLLDEYVARTAAKVHRNAGAPCAIPSKEPTPEELKRLQEFFDQLAEQRERAPSQQQQQQH